MKIIIVDDDTIIISDLKKSLDWDRLGIETIFSAKNIIQAKEIFEENEIDIMLCDIEMPHGSGLDLLKWVNENSPETVSLFLTCHADFNYAKEAIKMGCLDYILKPAKNEELQTVIKKAVENVNKQNAIFETSKYSNYWFKNKKLVIEQFWLDVLKRKIHSDNELIKKEAEARNIAFINEMEVVTSLICIKRWAEDFNQKDKRLMEFAAKNIIEETMIIEESDGVCVDYSYGKFAVLFFAKGGRNQSIKNLKINLKKSIANCRDYIGCYISCYMGAKAFPHELPGITEKLLDLDENNVVNDSGVFGLDYYTKSKSLRFPDMELWSEYLNKMSSKDLIKEIYDYLDNQSTKSLLDAKGIAQFHQDFMQVIYYVLKQNKIQAHQLLADEESSSLYNYAQNSIFDMKKWVEHAVNVVTQSIKEKNKGKNIVDEVKSYLKENIEQNICRKDIANHFFLNPDYMDRVFKAETGVSINKYLINERIMMAKNFLSKTEMPISTIAFSLGYKSVSNFSTAFRKETNINPSEYRKSHLYT